MQPGKPTFFGELAAHEAGNCPLPFFGLPGNPVSTAVTFLLFAAPLLSALAGRTECGPKFALARLAPPIVRQAKSGLTRFLPACCDYGAVDGGQPEVRFVPWHGSGDLAALAHSNAFIVVPEGSHKLEAGELVRILLF